jgi:protein-disulfide isomerase
MNPRSLPGALALATVLSLMGSARADHDLTAPTLGNPGDDLDLPRAADAYRVPLGRAPWRGTELAKVTIVEFADFQCPFSARVRTALQAVLREYPGQVKLVFKHYPLPFHQNARLAAEASLAAGEQGRFWEYHDLLFSNIHALKRPDLEQYALQAGLDLARFRDALDSGRLRAEVDEDAQLAGRIATGTPSFFVNGRLLSGAQPVERFRQIIDEELRRADTALAKGLGLRDLYEALTSRGRTERPPPAPRVPFVEDRAVYRVPLLDSPGRGPAHAKVTVVEFADLQCPFCARVEATLADLERDYAGRIRIVFKHNPLPFHHDADLAAQAAMAAHDQGKFSEYVAKLFANQRQLGRTDLEGYAQDLGLDLAVFRRALDQGKHTGVVARDRALAAKIGAGGTPTFFINGRKLVGAQPTAAFRKIIDEELGKADAALARGVAAADLYAELTKNGLERFAAPPPPPPAAGEDPKRVYAVPVGGGDPCRGSKNAAVTMVEFSDFQCPFCARVGKTVEALLQTYPGQVRICFKHKPLPFHQNAVPAAMAAVEAHQQSKFWEFHDRLFQNVRALSRVDLERHAQDVGLDVRRVQEALDLNRHQAVLDADLRLADTLGVKGTPTFFINGRKLVGAQPIERFKELIDEALKKTAP